MKSVEALKGLSVKASATDDASTLPHFNPSTHLARIELAPAEIPLLLGNGKLAIVAEELRKIGYAHVTLDLQGYRRGSTNEALIKEKRPDTTPAS
jgi:PP-loop superfamily ATP-utilizing enzyme